MRKMNCKLLAAALVAIQITAAAMPMCAMACETEQAETAQEQTEMVEEITEMLEETAEKTEEPAEAEAKEEKADEAIAEKTAEETEEAADAEAEPAEEAEEKDAPAAEQQAEEEEQPAAEEAEEEKNSENPEQGKAFEQTVTVDRVKIKVTAEEGAFEEGAKLSVVRVPSTQLKQVENAVCDARAKDELVKMAYAFDIKVLGQDGKILKPADGKKVKVSFETEEAADAGLNAVVYHILTADNTITAKKLVTTMNRTAKAAEAQTDGFSYYVVEFVAKTAENNESAKTEEDPAAKDTAKTAAEKQEVKKETKTESETKKESEVKKEKRDEKKTAAKDTKNKKTENKKTEKAKANTQKSPKTGDTSNAIFWIAMSTLAAGGIMGLLFFRKKQI
ncbi:MAG: LPXTG cell wall anchor domain-containing protein [Lachnospiraceae bacterium]|nr:LPXTG cell wall anchor domain-containing protein [Lachnospiraceae bacterium]